MPPFSWLVRLRFSLRKPYLSKDEGDFYVVENAIRKEKVLRLPMIAPTGWKGSLRAAAMMAFVGWYRSELAAGITELSAFGRRAGLVRLFGDEKEPLRSSLDRVMAEGTGEASEQVGERFRTYLKRIGYQAGNVEGRQGRLFFYATFLDRVGLEIINPHVRDRRVGKNPIVMESAPAGATGCFYLLYVPFDRAGEDLRKTAAEAAEDLEVGAEALAEMFTERGFGAKTSSGYGVARPRLPEAGSLHVADVGGALQQQFQSFDEMKSAAQALAGRLRDLGGEKR
jgi:CRISPR-associated protein Cmr2